MLALALSGWLSVTAHAQVREPDNTISAGEGAGTLSDASRPLRDDSVSVHHGSQTIGEASGGPVKSGPMHDGTSRGMLSGPVSDISSGPVSEPRPPLTSGAVTEYSTGAVKHDLASPLGERISQPLRELGPLQEQMRKRREQAERDALLAATQPAVPAVQQVAQHDGKVAPPEFEAPEAPQPKAHESEHAAPVEEALPEDTGGAAPEDVNGATGAEPEQPEAAHEIEGAVEAENGSLDEGAAAPAEDAREP